MLGIPMYGFTMERVCFTSLFGHCNLLDQIQSSLDNQSKVDLVANFVEDRMASASNATPAITYAANLIFESKGQCKIPDLIAGAYMSRRKFERKFLEEVGVSPKAYARIRRFGYTCSLMAGDREADMIDALHRGGYYDQSHFIRDFKYFSGRTPGYYVKNNEELANYVDKVAVVAERIYSG